MNSIRFHPEARAEFVHEVDYYAAISPSLGERFDIAVKAAVRLAAEFPDLGSAHHHGTRRVFPRKFPFSVVYLAFGAEIAIVAIAPDRRKPGYWRKRVRTLTPSPATPS